MRTVTTVKSIEMKTYVAGDGKEFSSQRDCQRYERKMYRRVLESLPHVSFNMAALCNSHKLDPETCANFHAVCVRDGKDVKALNQYMNACDGPVLSRKRDAGQVLLVGELEGTAWLLERKALDGLISDLIAVRDEIDKMEKDGLHQDDLDAEKDKPY